MTPIHFYACYLPNHHEFNVTVKFGKKRLFEKMTVAKFLRFARQQDRPLVVDGVTVTFNGTGAAGGEQQVRGYLKQVADSYVQMKYKQN